MKNIDQDNWVKNILADDAIDAVRRDSLSAGLGALRARKRRRAVVATMTAALPALAIAAYILAPGLREFIASKPATTTHAAFQSLATVKIYPAPSASQAPAVTPISDDDLLALFNDKHVNIVGQPGHQQLVFVNTQVEIQ